MTLALLKAEFKKKKLSTAGNKSILNERLLDAIAKNVTVCADIDTKIYPGPHDGIFPTAHWVELV